MDCLDFVLLLSHENAAFGKCLEMRTATQLAQELCQANEILVFHKVDHTVINQCCTAQHYLFAEVPLDSSKATCQENIFSFQPFLFTDQCQKCILSLYAPSHRVS
jgi:fructose/tagatose bisphosphate aldolase